MGLTTYQKLGSAIGYIEQAQEDLKRLRAVEEAVLRGLPLWSVVYRGEASGILFPSQKEAKAWARGSGLKVQKCWFCKQTGGPNG